ncbi:MAG: pentapeptide repeat-containing protein, partial [Alphaproteobacteria bacterium]|nr:pentapeptide repeat-containing protein [Alphaproteobacteria bacterium]
MTPAEFVRAIRLHDRFVKRQHGGERADLSGESLAGLRLQGINFRGAVLDGTDFSKCTLNGADFQNANLSSAKFDEIVSEDANFRVADLRGASFKAAKLKRASFKGADMRPLDAPKGGETLYCNLSGAFLEGANLQMCKLADANFDDANMQRATPKFTTIIARTCPMASDDSPKGASEQVKERPRIRYFRLRNKL